MEAVYTIKCRACDKEIKTSKLDDDGTALCDSCKKEKPDKKEKK